MSDFNNVKVKIEEDYNSCDYVENNFEYGLQEQENNSSVKDDSNEDINIEEVWIKEEIKQENTQEGYIEEVTAFGIPQISSNDAQSLEIHNSSNSIMSTNPLERRNIGLCSEINLQTSKTLLEYDHLQLMEDELSAQKDIEMELLKIQLEREKIQLETAKIQLEIKNAILNSTLLS